MKYIFQTVVRVAESMNDILRELMPDQGGEIEIRDFTLRYAADAIGTTAFGIECNSLKDPNSEFLSIARTIGSKPRHGAQFTILITTFANLARKLRIKSISDELSHFFLNILKETVEYREKSKIRRNDLLDILIGLKNQDSDEALTFNEIAGNAWVFFAGGLDSTSLALTNCLYCLALNPDIQTKARKIVLDSFKKNNGQFSYEMLMDVSYVEQIVKGL